MKLFSRKTLVLITALALFMAGSSAFAENTPFDDSPKSVGFKFVLGEPAQLVGLSYQQWFGKIGLETSMHLHYEETRNYIFSDTLVAEANIGIQYQIFKTVHNERISSSLFVFADAGAITAGSHKDSGEPGSGADKPLSFKTDALISLGIGYEIVLFDHFSIPEKVGYMARFPSSNGGLNLFFSSGIMYRF